MVSNQGLTALIGASFSHNMASVRLLLQKGALVNITTYDGQNALQRCLAHYGQGMKHIATFLMTAGEILDAKPVKKNESENDCNYRERVEILNYLTQMDGKLCLQDICRKTNRKPLIQVNPNLHLFGRVPKLGLPSSLTSYLLYYITLDD